MMEVYVEVDWKTEEVLSYSTAKNAGVVKVIQDDEKFDTSKIQGYTLTLDENDRYHLVFDEEKWGKYVDQKEKEEAVEAGKEMAKELFNTMVLMTCSDEDAYAMRYLYDPWEPNKSYVTGDRKLYGDNLYKCKQNHTSEDGPNRTPDYLPALWDLIAPDDPTIGTKDNPIIIPEPFSSMEYVKGKYYKEGNVLYLMNRQGMADGEKISLVYKPSQLVGHYFEIVS